MKRSCLGYPGYRCGRIVSGASRCDDCRRATYRVRDQHRPPGERAFYASAPWKRLASAVVDAAEACATCATSKALTQLTAGHLLSIRRHPALALDPSNVVAQCRPCQNRMQ